MGGIYNIKEWSDLVMPHLISGPDIVDGLQAAWAEASGKVVFTARTNVQSGNLLNPEYTSTVVEAGRVHPGVFGFIETDRILILYVNCVRRLAKVR